MFPQFKRVNNESGIVLFMVLMTSIIIMILSLSILTQSLNEINYAQQQIDQITASQWSRGVFWNAYSSNSFSPSMTNVGITTVMNGRTYQIAVNKTATPSLYNMTTNYDFQ